MSITNSIQRSRVIQFFRILLDPAITIPVVRIRRGTEDYKMHLIDSDIRCTYTPNYHNAPTIYIAPDKMYQDLGLETIRDAVVNELHKQSNYLESLCQRLNEI